MRGLLVFVSVIFLAFPTFAQDPPFTINFDSAHIVGTKENVIAHRVPVRNTTTGDVVLQDVSIRFSVDVNGQLILEDFSVTQSSSQLNSADNFLSGTYKSPGGNCFVVTDGGTTADGRSSGSIRSDSPTARFSAGWISGPVEGHPVLGGMEIASELQDGPSYGTVGDNNATGFCNGGLISAIQVGTGVTITAYHSFPNNSCINSENTSFGQANITFTLVDDESGCNTD